MPSSRARQDLPESSGGLACFKAVKYFEIKIINTPLGFCRDKERINKDAVLDEFSVIRTRAHRLKDFLTERRWRRSRSVERREILTSL